MLRTVLYGRLSSVIQKKLFNEFFENGTKLSEDQTRELATAHILELRNRWRAVPDAKCFSNDEPRKVLTRHSGKVNKVFAELFGDMSLGTEGMEALHELAHTPNGQADEYPPECTSGVVIAGFVISSGNIFPSCRPSVSAASDEGKIKYKLAQDRSVTSAQPSHVVPFAQTEMVETFLSGMSPQFEKQLWTNVVALIQAMPGLVVNEIAALKPEEKAALVEQLKPATLKAAQHVAQSLLKYRDEQHLQLDPAGNHSQPQRPVGACCAVSWLT